MSHHYPGPDFAFPHGDARWNVTDLYVFPKPGDDSKTILILNAHPSVGMNPRVPTTLVPFAPDGLYEIMIDTDGDTVVNVAYSVRFADSPGGGQIATLRRIDSTSSDRTGNDGVVVVEGVPVSMGREPHVATAGDYRFFVGRRSDPFFFDALGAINNLQFTGHDFFTDKNVSSIVLEVPNARFGSANLKLWGRTVDGTSGCWVQADRCAHASQEPFLSPPEQIAYITGEPANDAQFVPLFAHGLQHVGGYTPEGATQAANTLLPDVQPYQPGRPASYPSNGRALTDDASAHFLTVVTNGKITGDGVHPHTDLLAEFPYVGAPHAA
jgi:Domain of unknown function (DUF4331)